ncbi:hypothetical protein Bbelb_265480 [Branchiostoma belcheri]|nr:hypothetical protein Bbelb_265480 [Branchiostoma belcheri]
MCYADRYRPSPVRAHYVLQRPGLHDDKNLAYDNGVRTRSYVRFGLHGAGRTAPGLQQRSTLSEVLANAVRTISRVYTRRGGILTPRWAIVHDRTPAFEVAYANCVR